MFIEVWGFQGSVMGESTEMGPPNEWRVPIQERSRRRFDEILAAVSAELDDVGWQGLTIASVARRSNGSIGSVYRYFPDKLSLVAALIEQQNERWLSLLDADAHDETPFEDTVLAIVDRYGTEVRGTPGLLSISRAALVDGDAYQLFQRALCPVRQWTAEALGRRLPGLETSRLQEVAAVTVEAVQSLMFFSFHSDSPTRGDILQELRLIVRGYFNELRQEHDRQ